MAKVRLVLDDVVLALKNGKRQIADSVVSLSIPSTASPTGKRRSLRLDVSEEGLKMLKAAEASRDKIMEDAKEKFDEGVAKLQAEREKAEVTAWKDLNAIADKVEEMRPSRNRAEEDKKKDKTSDDSLVAANDPAPDAQPEAQADEAAPDSGGYSPAPAQDGWN